LTQRRTHPMAIRVKRVEHLGLIVEDVKEAAALYEKLFGLKATLFEEHSRDGGTLRIAFSGAGNTLLEFLATDAPSGPIADAIKRVGGPHLHHMAVEVEDIQEAVRELKEMGVRIAVEPREGSRGSTIAFLHPKDTAGTLIELVQPKAE
ncbi:MAG: VOC family protein, partial [Nitrospinota bacterium]